MLRLLYVYRWATFGGVERVLLSRAEAFKQFGMGVRIFVYFMEDSGAIEQIRNYIEFARLGEYIQLVTCIDHIEYDYIISIDTPEVLKYPYPRRKLLFECHTTYIKNREYLAAIPSEVKLIVVPSALMKSDLEQEWPDLKNKVVVVRNFVVDRDTPWEECRIWEKRPLLYLGRMDEHKNIFEILDIFAYYRSHYDDDLMLVLLGMVAGNIDLNRELRQRQIVDRTLIFPPVGFERVNQVYSLIKAHCGLFISSSLAESFGLSVAEALIKGLPVLLSGTRAHDALVQGNKDFLYPLGDVPAGAGKLKHLVKNYPAMLSAAEGCKGQFSMEAFISDWNCFIRLLSN